MYPRLATLEDRLGALAGLLLLAFRCDGLAPQGRYRAEMPEPPADHRLAATFPMHPPSPGVVARTALLDSSNDASDPERQTRWGVGPPQRAVPVGLGEALLRQPGLGRRQPMLGTKVPEQIRCGAIRRRCVRWLARGRWRRGPFRGPVRLRVLVQAVESGSLGI